MSERVWPRATASRSREREKWDFSSGEGATPAQREAEKPQLVLFTLTSVLISEPRFWEDVELVRADFSRAEKIAGRYGSGRRRRSVIAHRLRTAAAVECDRKAAIRRLFAAAYYEPLPRAGTRGTYRYRPEFLRIVQKGARLIALRGAGKCFVCDAKLAGRAKSGGRTVRRDYCSAHEPSRWEDEQAAARREYAIATVFEHAARATSALPLPPRAPHALQRRA